MVNYFERNNIQSSFHGNNSTKKYYMHSVTPKSIYHIGVKIVYDSISWSLLVQFSSQFVVICPRLDTKLALRIHWSLLKCTTFAKSREASLSGVIFKAVSFQCLHIMFVILLSQNHMLTYNYPPANFHQNKLWNPKCVHTKHQPCFVSPSPSQPL